jgi:ATP-binding cassette subfamily B multidrug efflux pump
VTAPQRIAPPAGGGPMSRMGSFGMPLERSKDFGGTFSRLARRLRPQLVRLLAVVLLSMGGVTFSVLGPRMLGHGTDLIVNGLIRRQAAHRGGIDFSALHRTLEEVIGLYIASAGLNYLQAYTLAGVVQRSMFRLRSDVEDKLNRLPLSYVDKAARGDMLSRVTNDIDNLAQGLQQTISQLMTNTFMLIGTIVMMVLLSPLLALVAILTVPLSAFLIRLIAKQSRVRFIAQWMNTGRLNALVEESLAGHAIVKAFGRQRDTEETYRAINQELFGASFTAQSISGSIQPSMVLVGNLNFVGIAVIGGLRVAARAMSIGDVQAFIQYSRTFSQPLQMLASMANVFQSALASAERVFELLDAEEQTPERDEEPVEAPTRGRVEFDHVYFSYEPERPLITDLSLVAQPGATVAVVGPTGAGKTTLVNLIMRFYELDAGRITLDGRDISAMPRHQLRANIGMVLQDTWLFGGTIWDNIAYGRPGATDQEILEAAQAAYVDRFVHALPEAYQTLVDDEGGAMSAGEKQLITIARAFLADPSILILDEATSSVDTRTEVLIQEAMAQLRARRTSFVIAHRLSTIRNADTILVMDGGRIVEQGNHRDLLARGGPYAQLHQAQFTGMAAEPA